VRPYEALTQDIPAGSANGPLAEPTPVGGSVADDGSVQSPLATKSTGSRMPLVLGVLAGLTLILLLVVVVVVSIRRSRRRSPVLPPPPGPLHYGGAPVWPVAQQVPPQAYPPHQTYPYQPPDARR